jgi:hypothetical protein
MLTDNFETAELLVTTFFKIDALKRSLRIENNLKLVDYLQCYDHLNHMLNQAVHSGNQELCSEKIARVASYVNMLIEYSESGNHCLNNLSEAREILKEIRQRVQLISTVSSSVRDSENLKQ